MRLKYATTRSPPGPTCDSTRPSPSLIVPMSRMKGRHRSGYASTRESASDHAKLVKLEQSSVHLKLLTFCVRSSQNVDGKTPAPGSDTPSSRCTDALLCCWLPLSHQRATTSVPRWRAAPSCQPRSPAELAHPSRWCRSWRCQRARPAAPPCV